MTQPSRPDAGPESKESIRQRILRVRQGLSRGEIAYRSELAYRQFLTNLDRIRPPRAKCAALYYPIRGEVDVGSFFRFFQARGFSCAFPRMGSMGLDFFTVRSCEELKISRFGIGEPQPRPGTSPVDPDIVIVPAIAFSYDGYRIGFGAGHYDRTVARWIQDGKRSSIQMIGLAYDFQVVPTFSHESHDQPLDAILTETTFRKRET